MPTQSKIALITFFVFMILFLKGCTLPSWNTEFLKEDAEKIDARIDVAISQLFEKHPNLEELGYKSAGVLIMPLITEAGLMYGGSYGRGALRVNNETVDYYSATTAGIGYQIGAQQYGHILFFMTQQSLDNFQNSEGWSLRGEAEYTVPENAENLRAETWLTATPVVAIVFGQAGLKYGISLEGTKYKRITP